MSVTEIVDDLFDAVEEVSNNPRMSEQDVITAMKRAVVKALYEAMDAAVVSAVDLAVAEARRQHAHW